MKRAPFVSSTLFVSAIIVKGWFYPSWSTAFELLVVSALLAIRWMWCEPKEVTETDKMKRAVENLASQLSIVSDTVNQVKNVQSELKLGHQMGRR